MKPVLLIAGVLFLAAQSWAASPESGVGLSLDSGAELTFNPSFSTTEFMKFEADSTLFTAVARLSAHGDGQYGPDIANFSSSKKFFNTYVLMDEGYLRSRPGPFDFQLGRYRQYDEFSSPYSLFLNSEGHSALGMRIRYEDSWFAYESRWISLNNRSNFGSVADTPAAWQQVWTGSGWQTTGTGFPDRGANLKTFLFKFGKLHVGLQDAGIYTGRSFDLEYFLSPLPEYFTQYFYNTAGRPWTTSGNENNLLGFFVTWTDDAYDWGAQVLIDDFSLHFLLPNSVPDNPWKAAWTVGGSVQTEYGRFGIYHAGALKYTFEPISTSPGQESQSAYGYTYFPDVEYSTGDGAFRSFKITDNALGYLYGENNLAVRLTYENEFVRQLFWATNLELLVAGSNSPANPWQDATASSSAGGTSWLNDSVLERSMVWTSDLRWSSGDWQFYVDWQLGYTANVLALESPSGSTTNDSQGWSALDNWVRIFKPSSSGEAVVNAALGVTYHWDVSSWQRSLVR